MKKFLLSIIALFAFTVISGQELNPNQMINIAGKQRMLSQKMAKAYLMRALGFDNGSVTKDLNISKIVFQRNIESLSSNATKVYNSSIKNAINIESREWETFKSLLDLPINKQNASKVLKQSSKLLTVSHEAVVKMEKLSASNAKYATTEEILGTINLSGKQRMLSQKACLYYLASRLFENKENYNTLTSVFHNIDEALVTLLNKEINSPDIEEAIGNALLTFEALRAKRESFLNGKISPQLVFETTNTLTKEFDKVTHLYSEISAN